MKWQCAQKNEEEDLEQNDRLEYKRPCLLRELVVQVIRQTDDNGNWDLENVGRY